VQVKFIPEDQLLSAKMNTFSFFLNLGIVYLEDARGSASCRKEAFKAIGNGFQEFINFQEYSDQYPHEEYSIGLNGRPGGLGFYINLTVRNVDMLSSTSDAISYQNTDL
jgi:hypothetical protein